MFFVHFFVFSKIKYVIKFVKLQDGKPDFPCRSLTFLFSAISVKSNINSFYSTLLKRRFVK